MTTSPPGPRSRDAAARFAAVRPRLRTIATTGTNGKTTTTSMVAAIVAAAGEVSIRVTTVGAWVGDVEVAERSLQRQFLGAVEGGVARGARTLALEVTSTALQRGLAQRWPADVAVFTNLTRDHLDQHGSPEGYLAAKAQLFLTLPAGGVAVLNADDPASALLREVIPAGVRVLDYSIRDAAASLCARAIELGDAGTTATLAPGPLAGALGGELRLGCVGGVHVQNALGAALAAHAVGYDAGAITRGLAGFTGVAGRFQIVGRRPLVVVDYAHTPDGLRGTLNTARELCRGALVCVFGCGGQRDRGKRPQMGAIVDQLADQAVLTSDNPRREPPAAIAAEVLAGVPAPRARWRTELDRRTAIRTAVAAAGPDDVVVIAGKGHETTQEIAGATLPFDDVLEARAAIAARERPAGPDSI
jgi:UDP-N-acetylmuramoyl-L-alanyl-D-glutamate--2,6-diaminopimelate ligase